MGRFRSLFTRSSSPSFQILSDLHLEVGQQYSAFQIPPSAPYLILAGDIGRLIDYAAYLDFLARHIERFNKVFLILGNHEFYELSISAGIEEAERLEREPVLKGKLVFLNQTRFDVPGSSVTILGCTLWSKIAEEARDIVQMRVKDFQKIESRTINCHNADYESDMIWLKGQIASVQKENQVLANGPPRRMLVVTHHAPSMKETASPNQVDNPWSSAFATDLLVDGDGGEWVDVKAWVFGHTHFTTEFKKCGITVVSNQRGYVLPGSKSLEKMHSTKDKKTFNVKRVVWV
jgi:predicted phosphodiesterase